MGGRTVLLLGLLGLLGCEERRASASSEPSPSASAAAAPTPAAPVVEAPGDAALPKAARLVVLAGGDVSLGRGAGRRILENADYDPLVALAPLFKRADLRMANLESQLSDQGGETQSRDNPLVFTGPPGGARLLARAGFQLVSFANNHAWDYGKPAFLESIDHLERAGVVPAGVSREPGRALEPRVLTVNGWSIAVFAVTQIWNQGSIHEHEGRHHVAWADFPALKANLERARREHDLVLVSYHGGEEYSDVPMQWTRDFAKAVMDAGADAFFGHHPHVPQGIGWHGQKPVFYSLGNLVFAMHSDYPWTGTSFMARVTFHSDGRISAEACPYDILGHSPLPFSGKTREVRERVFAQHLRVSSLAAGGSEVGAPGEGSCMPVMPPTPKRKR